MKYTFIGGSPEKLDKNLILPESIVIAIDSGFDRCADAGVVPDLLIGDLDSVRGTQRDGSSSVFRRGELCSPKDFEKLVKGNLKANTVRPYDAESEEDVPLFCPVIKKEQQDDTDTFFALKYAISKGADEILFLCCVEGRLDHGLANIGLLLYCRDRNIKAHMAGIKYEIRLISNEICITNPRAFKYLSLVPIFCEEASGVAIRGAKYPVENYRLPAAPPMGVSNEFSDETVYISVEKGNLFLILTND